MLTSSIEILDKLSHGAGKNAKSVDTITGTIGAELDGTHSQRKALSKKTYKVPKTCAANQLGLSSVTRTTDATGKQSFFPSSLPQGCFSACSCALQSFV